MTLIRRIYFIKISVYQFNPIYQCSTTYELKKLTNLKTNMSDGNYNRALLPKNELAAGLRAGKAQMRVKAVEAFDAVCNEFLQDMQEDERERMKARFMEVLSGR